MSDEARTYQSPGYTLPTLGSGGGDPGDPDPGGGGPGEDSYITFLESAFGVVRAFGNTQSGTVVANAGSGDDGAIVGSPYNLKQPSLLTGDIAQSIMIRTGASITFPAGIMPGQPLAIGMIYQRLSLGDTWQNLWSCDGEPSAAWGMVFSHKNDGGFRLTVRDAEAANVAIDTDPALAAINGDIIATLVICDGSGCRVYIGDNTVRASNAIVLGGAPPRALEIGRWRESYAPSRLNALVQFIGVRSGSALSSGDITTFMGGAKTRVRWINGVAAGSLEAGSTSAPIRVTDSAAFKGDRSALTMSVSEQPASGIISFDGNNDAVIAVGNVPGAQQGLISFEDANGAASQPAALSWTVIDPAPPPSSGSYELWEAPFLKTSAWNIPIGLGATLEGPTATKTANFLQMNTIRMGFFEFGPGTYPFGGCWFELAEAGDETATVYHDGVGTGIGMPQANIKMPDVRFLDNTSGDRNIIVIDPDGDTVRKFYHFRWTGSRYEAELCRVHSLSGLGHGTTPGDRVGSSASGVALIGGYLKPSIVETPGREWPNMIHITVPRNALPNSTGALSILNTSTRLPATTIDSHPARNDGENDYGEVYTVETSLNLDSFGFDDIQMRFAQCVRRRGLMIVDGGGTVNGGFRAFNGISVSAAEKINAAASALHPYLRRITNGTWFNGQTTRGGGQPRDGAVNYGLAA